MSTHTPYDRPATFTGRPVLDEHGLALGTITDVVFDAHGEHAEYLVVDPGILRAAHYVPVRGAFESADGTVVVPWDRQWFKLAPKAGRDHVLSPIERRSLEVHYARR
jgi:sporulation protein YlmC with PRC-barrel domain